MLCNFGWNVVSPYNIACVPALILVKNVEEEEELRALRPGMNEASFRTRPHHNVHRTMGVDT
jgi:hypothetical protein